MRVALVYDRVNKWGGAESVLLALHEIWPDAPLYTSVYDPSMAEWAKVFDVRTSFIQRTPLPKDRHEMYPFLMGPAFETFNLDQYDIVISVTHEFAKAIITKPKTFHLCYCLTPVGYLWSGYEHYHSGRSNIFKRLTFPVVRYLRWYDQIVSHRPDQYVAISNAVSSRIKKYYQQDGPVIYPPVTFPETQNQPLPGEYYLIVSRLVPNKRLDIAIVAFNRLGLPLKIVGIGKEEKRLKAMAKKNIEFLGYLTAQDLGEYYRRCLALIVPGEEDFGIVAVEAQGFGKPAIAFSGGGAKETVIDGKTGWLFRQLSSSSLMQVIRSSKIETIDPKDCISNAKKFSKERFKTEFKKFVEENLTRYQKKYVL